MMTDSLIHQHKNVKFVQITLKAVPNVQTALNVLSVIKFHIVTKFQIHKVNVNVKINIRKMTKIVVFIAQSQVVRTVRDKMYVNNVILHKDLTKQ